MGAEALGDLIINVGVDTKDLAAGLDNANAQVKHGAEDMSRSLDGLGEAARSMGQQTVAGFKDAGDGAEKFSQDLAQSLTRAATAMQQSGMALSEAITVPLAALGAGALAAAVDFDTAFKQIDRQAGGTAEELAGMQAAFKDLFSTLPQSAHDVAAAIGEISDRLGLVGKPLEDMSAQMLNLARVTGESVVPLIEATTRAFGQWNVATKDQATALDHLMTVARATGEPVQKLAQQLTQFGPTLREMGFSFDQAAAMLGKFEKEGVNTGAALTGLRQSLLKLGKAGVEDPILGLQEVVKWIKEAGSQGEANARGLKVFGRGATDLVDAIRRGKLDMEDFTKNLYAMGESVNAVAKRTLTFGEQFNVFRHQLETALAPLGDVLLKILESLMQKMQPVIAIIGDLAKAFADLSPTTQAFILALVAAAAAAGPMLLAFSAMTRGLAGLVTLFEGAGASIGAGGFMAAIEGIGASLVGVLLPAIAAVAAAFGAWSIITNVVGIFTDLNDAFHIFGAEAKDTAADTGTLKDRLAELPEQMSLAAAAMQALSEVWKEFKATVSENFHWDLILAPPAAMIREFRDSIKDMLPFVDQLSDKFRTQLTGAIHATTKSSTDFQDAWSHAVKAAADGVGAYGIQGLKVKQTTTEIRDILDSLGQHAEKTGAALKAIPFKDMIPVETLVALKVFEDEHRKAFDAIVKATEAIQKERDELGPLAQGMSDVEVVTESTARAFDKLTGLMNGQLGVIEETGTVWKEFQRTLDLIVSSGAVGKLNADIATTDKEFQTLGLHAQTSLADQWTALNDLITKGLLTEKQGLLETRKLLEETIQYEKDTGAQVTDDQLARLAQVKDALKKFGVDPVWKAVQDTIAQTFKTLGDGLANALFDFKNFGKDMLGTLKQIGEEIVKNLINNFILSKKNLDELSSGVTSLLHSLFGVKPPVGGVKIPGLPGGGAPGSSAGGSLPGGLPSSGDPTGGAASGGATGGLLGNIGSILNVVTGAISAISGVIGNFQMAHLNNTVNAMERETARMAIYLGDQAGNSIQFYTGKTAEILGYVQNLLSGPIAADLDNIKSTLWSIGGKGAGAAGGLSTQLTAALIAHLPKLDTIDDSCALIAHALMGTKSGPTPATAGAGGAQGYNNYYLRVEYADVASLMDQMIAELRKRGLKI